MITITYRYRFDVYYHDSIVPMNMTLRVVLSLTFISVRIYNTRV